MHNARRRISHGRWYALFLQKPTWWFGLACLMAFATFAEAQCCSTGVPFGETNLRVEQKSTLSGDPNFTISHFFVQLTPSTFSFPSGRETNDFPGTDTCWFSGNTINIPEFPTVPTTLFNTVAGNDIYTDDIGAVLSAAQYISTQAPSHGVTLPCTATLHQLMEFQCFDTNPTTFIPYTHNTVTITIDRTTVHNCRGHAGTPLLCETILF